MYESYRGVQSLKRPKYAPQKNQIRDGMSALTRVNLFLMLSALAVLGFYIVQINSMIGMGYEIDRLSLQREGMDAFNNDMAVKTDYLRSVGLLEAQAYHMNMISTSQISYLNIADIVVASSDPTQHN